MERKYVTVSALNRYLKYKFDQDINLQKILLKAEISNFKRHSHGHLYLTLKDDQSEISAIMFASHAKSLAFNPKDGDQVIVEGHLSVYEPRGQYQIYIRNMQMDGIGDLYLAYEALKEALEKQGYFDATHKQPIPKFPKTVGVITSPTGAAVRDIINVIKLRFPLTNILIYPALVQGAMAKDSITKQIEQANKDHLVDVLIVGRGGGSIEDLWAFNEEIVAKAIFDSKIPVISAVGHETDFTIADFVSDVRASTPSHAAELAVPSKDDIFENLTNTISRLNQALNHRYVLAKKRFVNMINAQSLRNPEKLLEAKMLKLLYLEDKLNAYQPKQMILSLKERLNHQTALLHQLMTRRLETSTHAFMNMTEKLELVNPLAIMKKGYTITKQSKQIKKSIHEVEPEKPIEVLFYDGSLTCVISKKEVKS